MIWAIKILRPKVVILESIISLGVAFVVDAIKEKV